MSSCDTNPPSFHSLTGDVDPPPPRTVNVAAGGLQSAVGPNPHRGGGGGARSRPQGRPRPPSLSPRVDFSTHTVRSSATGGPERPPRRSQRRRWGGTTTRQLSDRIANVMIANTIITTIHSITTTTTIGNNLPPPPPPSLNQRIHPQRPPPSSYHNQMPTELTCQHATLAHVNLDSNEIRTTSKLTATAWVTRRPPPPRIECRASTGRGGDAGRGLATTLL